MFECFGIDVRFGLKNASIHQFILLRGHEGAGKSTFARHKIAEFQQNYLAAEIVYIDNDVALTDEFGHYHFDFTAFTQAHRNNMLIQQAALRRGQDHPECNMLIINANPNQKAKTCHNMIQAALQHDFVVGVYRLHYFFPNVHGVSQADVQQSYARLNANPVDGEIHLGKAVMAIL